MAFLDNSSGVYKIINKINGKFYIGSTSKRGLKSRWSDHIKELDRNTHRNSYLQNAWNKYSKDNFEFEIICYCDPDKCLFFEQKCLDTYKTWERNIGYNICIIAGSSYGVKRTKEYKEKAKKSALNRFQGQKLENHPNAKLNWDIVKTIRKESQEGLSLGQIAKKYNVKKASIWKVVKNYSWTNEGK